MKQAAQAVKSLTRSFPSYAFMLISFTSTISFGLFKLYGLLQQISG